MAAAVPSPYQPRYTARSLLDHIIREGGKAYRMRELMVFVLTTNPELAQELLDMGAVPFLPRGMERSESTPFGGYRHSRGGPVFWDVYIHHIPIRGAESIWEAAARKKEITFHEVGEPPR